MGLRGTVIIIITSTKAAVFGTYSQAKGHKKWVPLSLWYELQCGLHVLPSRGLSCLF